MNVKKEFLKFFVVILFLGLAGTAFGYGVKKLQTPPAEAKKSNKEVVKTKNKEEEKSRAVEAPAETLPVTIQDSVVQQESSANQGDQDISLRNAPPAVNSQYPIHQNITTTFFWAGEEAGKDNQNISNLPSAWDEQWVKHFGGVDDPNKRSGFFPAKFAPKENPFYFALPYNDFDSNGKRKQEVYSLIPWAKENSWGQLESVCKNRWIKIMKGGKSAYAQWQDVGPFKEDDKNYVFGTAAPKSKINDNAGLDVSPAVNQYLGLTDVDKTDWQFIDVSGVPDGPWKKVVTTSQCYWN
ncbi:MAG TPA: hypothetical protein VF390_00555 [Patescibacteria group bacterium]